MEALLEPLEPIPQFPTSTYYKHKEDDFIYTDNLGGPEFWKKFGNSFESRESDVYIVSLQRTGTTWTSELVYLIMNDLDYDKAKNTANRLRMPYLNFAKLPEDVFNIPSPRILKTHLPYTHLPRSITDKKCKLVYTLRNPKDTLVSYYNFALMNKHIGFVGTFDDMFELFMNNRLACGPFWKHVLSYWEHKNDENVFFLSFEERKKDLFGSIKRLCDFLGKKYTDEQIKGLAEHCSFHSMKSNPAVNQQDIPNFDRTKSDFIRKGEVGDWKNYFSPEQNEKMNEYVQKYFEGSGLKFEFEV